MSRELNHQQGFTLVELMIATAVFGVMLLLITSGILQIGRTYYKGITESKTQDTARSIVDAISQDIQFSGSTINEPAIYPGTGLYAICIGANRYSAQLFTQLVGSSHALLVDQPASCVAGTLASMPVSANSRELLASNMRLQVLTVNKISTNLYKIRVKIIYGDSDLLCNTSTPATCSGGAMSPADFKSPNLTCKLQTGDQFCAVSDLTTIVQKQIT